MANYMKPVVFRLGNQKFGVDINLVQSIEKDIEVVNVPNAMQYISGIVNMRGEVIPVYSLHKKFNIQEEDYKRNDSIIVSLPDMKLAIEVDEVLEIGDIQEKDITNMPMIAKTDDTGYLDRVANVKGSLIILLDIVQLLTEAEAANVKEFTDKLSQDN